MTAKIEGFHHVKFPVRDLARSREWYERALGLEVTHEFPDDDGVDHTGERGYARPVR
ncbi:VOC family protein [Amycolatopsis balhimycina]|uniref:VOC family protein n=1 Tax=Amycolatopsis balhimycina TaxID=208443 RepID=UPI00036690B5|nr:VOC family protein [Amycolatopsis balhimycina]